MPELHVITGSNGAGKSSVGPEYLPSHIKKICTVFDGDKFTLHKTKELFATKLHSHKKFPTLVVGSYDLKSNHSNSTINCGRKGRYNQRWGSLSAIRKYLFDGLVKSRER